MSSSSRIHIKSQAVAHSYNNVSSGEAEAAWGGGGGVEELGVGDGLTSQPHLFGEIQGVRDPVFQNQNSGWPGEQQAKLSSRACIQSLSPEVFHTALF